MRYSNYNEELYEWIEEEDMDILSEEEILDIKERYRDIYESTIRGEL